jgi:NDP-sugar pyrophosphorylase family protein
MTSRETAGAIIAAGEGRRLREAGWALPKPLVPVAGVPLLGSVIANFQAARIRSICVIVNEQDRDCSAWAQARFPGLDLRFIVKTTSSSLESFREVLAVSRGPRVLLSTVDAWCVPADFVRFADAAERRPVDATVLGVTDLLADEKPLWVRLAGDGRITEMGGARGDGVTAGLYLVSERVRAGPVPAGLERLREYLVYLCRRGEPLYAEWIPNVVDVDRPDDVALAEAMAARVAPPVQEGLRSRPPAEGAE